ncbi:MAG: alpha/beta hydrolase [Planctomycetes bacterium]|nr:alpha/beta hydrolase [Planctomycetota bacterium]
MNTPSEPARPRARALTRTVWRAARTLLITYGTICLLMFLLETKIVYPAPPSRSKPAAKDFGFEEVHFQSADGTALHGWYHAHPEPRFGLLYCHGNGEDITHNADLVHHFHNELAASVFIFDYRGYGQSAGSPHEAVLIADGLAAQRWLAERLEVETDQLVLIGRSLGGAVAVALAEQQGARALVLQNTFASMVDVAAEKFPWLPIRWMMRNRYPSAERIQAYHGPLLQSHGTADQVIPFAMGKELFEASPSEKKRFLEIPDGSHNDPQPEPYYEMLADFLGSLEE